MTDKRNRIIRVPFYHSEAEYIIIILKVHNHFMQKLHVCLYFPQLLEMIISKAVIPIANVLDVKVSNTKLWHVRTKENIARVRKDEAEAAEKERLEKVRIENADREARLNVLKQKSKQKLLEFGCVKSDEELLPASASQPQHINLFTDLNHAVSSTNKEHDIEVKEKKEEYEKKIGYLTYLGQDTNEALKKKNWYDVLPESRFSQSSNIKDTYEKLVLKDPDGKPKSKELDVKDGEVGWKAKQRLDPMNNFKEHCLQLKKSKTNLISPRKKPSEMESKSISKKKEVKRDNTEKEKKILKLRAERVKRELAEKHRTELFLSGLHGETSKLPAIDPQTSVKAKYNSQFNPELARQNYK